MQEMNVIVTNIENTIHAFFWKLGLKQNVSPSGTWILEFPRSSLVL